METDKNLNEQMNAFVCKLIDTGVSREEAVKEFRKLFTVQVLTKNRGNQCKAARQLQVHRNTLTRELKSYNFDMNRLRQMHVRKPSGNVSLNRIAKAS